MKVVQSLALFACVAAVTSAVAQGSAPAGAGKSHNSAANSPRYPLVLAMPKTYGKTETMGIWGGYFSHLSQCANVSLRNQIGESLDQSTNVDTLAEKDLIDAVKTG